MRSPDTLKSLNEDVKCFGRNVLAPAVLAGLLLFPTLRPLIDTIYNSAVGNRCYEVKVAQMGTGTTYERTGYGQTPDAVGLEVATENHKEGDRGYALQSYEELPLSECNNR